MKKYISKKPSFTEEIDLMENADPVNAETVTTVPLKQLADNTIINHKLIAALTTRIEQLEEAMRRTGAFSYDSGTKGISTSADGVTYDTETGGIIIPTDIAEYNPDSEGIVLSGGGGGGGGGAYILPIASPTRLGGVKIGEGVKISEDGTLSVDVTEATAEAAAGIAEEIITAERNDLSDDDVDYIVGD